uniref:Putative gamma-butyrobetaine hydroxylase n=1 Tax=Moniliophthora roreri TaxID=221103 RepID=A0A0W0GAZ6_MONRR
MEHTSLKIDSLNASFPYVWLRDSCQSEDCVHPSTSQKLHQSSDIPQDISPVSVKMTEDGIAIDWVDGHKSVLTHEFLKRHSSPKNLSTFHKDVLPEFWDNKTISASSDLFLSYGEVKTPAGLLKAIDQLCRYGLLFLRGVPNSRTEHESCELRHLATLFSDIRHTFYGTFWDVQAKNTENIAYTDLRLWFHMDMLYLENPPRYQVLHSIRNRVQGGSSVFVDSFKAAMDLKASNPSDFDVLANTSVPFQYVFNNRHYHQVHATIQLEPAPSTPGGERAIQYVNYAPPFQAPLLLATPPEFYRALKWFDEVLNAPGYAYEYTLQEGDAVIFDNRRVLHARTAFQDKPGEPKVDGVVNRWLQGCYFEGDLMWNQGRVLREKKERGEL